MPRDYKAEYAKFHSSTASKKDRASRNKVRREAERKGIVRKGIVRTEGVGRTRNGRLYEIAVTPRR